MKRKILIALSRFFFAAMVMLALAACPPPDGEDFQYYAPGDFVDVKFLYFDDRPDGVKETNSDEKEDSNIYPKFSGKL
jgi:hypothetical protein